MELGDQEGEGKNLQTVLREIIRKKLRPAENVIRVWWLERIA